jgi:hypothetical protein
MNQITDLLKGVDRNSIIKGLAGYLVIYAVVNICGGLVFTLAGALTGVGAAVSSAAMSGATQVEGAQAAGQLGALSIFAVVLGCLYLLSTPVFFGAAYGLYKYKKWARMGAVIALVVSIVLSVLTIGNSFISSIFWIAVSAFFIYFFWTDPEIKTLLSK